MFGWIRRVFEFCDTCHISVNNVFCKGSVCIPKPKASGSRMFSRSLLFRASGQVIKADVAIGVVRMFAYYLQRFVHH